MFPSLTLAILLATSAAQARSPPGLYIIENKCSDEGVIKTRNLVRLSFDRDGKLAKETLLSKDQRFFSNFGHHRIALGRFIVTPDCGIIDIPARKVIHDEQDGVFLGLENGKVVYRVDNDLRLTGLFSFDLNTRKFGKINSRQHWDLPGVKSPDKTMSVESAPDGVIRLYRLGKAPKELGKGFYFTYSVVASPTGEGVPCLWLDAERILTVWTNSKLVMLTTQGAVEEFAEVKGAPMEVLSPPRLWLDKRARTIYSFGWKDFLIDVRSQTASALKNFALGHGFEASIVTDKKGRRTVYHDGKAIGQWVFDPYQTETAPGLVAFGYVTPAEDANVGYPDGVAVWNTEVGDWRTIEIRVSKVIGWAK
jgi:hypothetical protein